MVAGKNYNIVTKLAINVGKGSHVAFGSSVAAGKTRYVTYVRVAQVANGASKGSRVYFCSTAASNSASTIALASAAQKLIVGITSAAAASAVARFAVPNKTIAIPNQPNTKNPLFTIAASKWFTAKLGSATAGTSASVSIFVQYYDQ